MAERDADLLGSAQDLDRLRVAFVRIARRIRTSAPDTVTASQLSTLGTVLTHGPCTIGQIAEIEHVQPPSASKIVSSLETAGLVGRTADPHDRRCSLIVVTPAGLELAEEVRAAGRGWLAGQLPHISADDLARIAHALPALERLLAAGEPTPPVERFEPDEPDEPAEPSK